MDITIRPAEPEDYDGVIGLLDEWWGGRQMQLMLPRLFFVHFRPWTYVAERDGAVAGFLAALRSQTDPSQVYCHFVGIAPTARGRGIGEALHQRLFVDAVERGCGEVLAVTSPRNAESIAFHSRLGFLPLVGLCHVAGVPYTPSYDGPGEDRVRLVKSLTGAAAAASAGAV